MSKRSTYARAIDRAHRNRVERETARKRRKELSWVSDPSMLVGSLSSADFPIHLTEEEKRLILDHGLYGLIHDGVWYAE